MALPCGGVGGRADAASSKGFPMLTLVRSLTIEGYTVYRDDAVATRFYVMPSEPRIARDAQGLPIFSLIVYREDEDRISVDDLDEDVGGGILTFTTELAVDDKDFRKIERKLRGIVYGEDSVDDNALDIELDYVTFTTGKVQLAIAGEHLRGEDEGENNEFLSTIVGDGKVSGIGANRKAIMAKLTQSGAALMSQLDRLRTLPINVEYILEFEHRLVGVKMRVWCNMTSAYTLSRELISYTEKEERYADSDLYHTRTRIKAVREEFTRNKVCGVEVEPLSSEVDSDTLLAMEKFGFDMLEREMGKMIEARPTDNNLLEDTWLEDYVSSATNNFNFTLDRKMVLVRDHIASANIQNVLREVPDEMITFVDLRTDFFSFLKVPVRVNANFKDLPIDSVTVHLQYQRQRVGGRHRGDQRELQLHRRRDDPDLPDLRQPPVRREVPVLGRGPLLRLARDLPLQRGHHQPDLPRGRRGRSRPAPRGPGPGPGQPQAVPARQGQPAVPLGGARAHPGVGDHPLRGQADRELDRGDPRDPR